MKSCRGFTLIEMLVAIALLSIIGMALISFLPTIVTLNRNSTQDQEITVAAKQFFEEVRRDWATPTTFEAGTIPNPPEGCSASIQDPDSGAPGIRKRVTLACDDGASSFVAEFGRPS